jgi:hypothetical protein
MKGRYLKLNWLGWGRFAWDFFVIQIGFLLFGLAIDVIVQASIGLDPWDVLQMALTYHLPITLGESSIGVAFFIILLDVALREPLGWGTVANMIFIGVWVDALRPYVPQVPGSIIIQLAYLLLGVLIMGFASAIYIGVDAGAGPRDTLMLAISRLFSIFRPDNDVRLNPFASQSVCGANQKLTFFVLTLSPPTSLVRTFRSLFSNFENSDIRLVTLTGYEVR